MAAGDDELDISNSLGDFTLEDTYDHLKQCEKELREQLDELTNIAVNNGIQTLSPTVTPDIIRNKKCRFLESTLENIDGYDTKTKPFPRTLDAYYDTISALEEEVRSTKKMSEAQRLQKIDIENDIAYLIEAKNGIQRMREASLNAIEEVANSTYDAEIATARKIFSSVKSDLAEVVSMIVPDNMDFNQLLGDLTAAYTRGGDEVYIDVTPHSAASVQLLIESDVAMYHRNDKTKIRMMDLI